LVTFLFALAGGISQAVCGYSIRTIQARSRNAYASVVSNYLVALLVALIYAFIFSSAEAWGRAILVGVPGGIFYTVALLALIRSMNQRGLAITSAFSGLSLLVPTIISIFWGDVPTGFQILGIIFASAAMPLLSLATATGTAIRERPKLRQAIVLFFLQGAAMSSNLIAFKVVSPPSIGLYLVTLFSCGLLLSLVIWRLSGKKMGTADVRRGVIFGLLNVFSTLIILTSLAYVSGAIFFAVMGLLGLSLTTLVSFWLWHERIRSWGWVGLFLAVLAVLLLNLHF